MSQATRSTHDISHMSTHWLCYVLLLHVSKFNHLFVILHLQWLHFAPLTPRYTSHLLQCRTWDTAKTAWMCVQSCQCYTPHQKVLHKVMAELQTTSEKQRSSVKPVDNTGASGVYLTMWLQKLQQQKVWCCMFISHILQNGEMFDFEVAKWWVAEYGFLTLATRMNPINKVNFIW